MLINTIPLCQTAIKHILIMLLLLAGDVIELTFHVLVVVVVMSFDVAVAVLLMVLFLVVSLLFWLLSLPVLLLSSLLFWFLPLPVVLLLCCSFLLLWLMFYYVSPLNKIRNVLGHLLFR